jgi:oligoendopeptidase F
MTTTLAAPRWDLSFLFSSPISPEFELACENSYKDLESLGALFSRVGIDNGAADSNAASVFDQATSALNDYLLAQRRITAYLHGLVTTSSNDEAAQAKLSEFESRTTLLRKLTTRFTAWIGAQDIEDMLAKSAVARDHEYMMRKSKEAAQHLMSPAEEALAADLGLTGSNAWGKLHGNMTSQLEVEVGDEKVPMSVVRNRA